MRLKDKIALVTGGSSGIGKETCLLFAEEGAKVIVVDINKKDGEEIVRKIRNHGGEAAFCKADVSRIEDCRSMIDFTEEQFGGMHIMFNNAGIMHSDDGNSQSTEEEVWNMTMDINAKGVFF